MDKAQAAERVLRDLRDYANNTSSGVKVVLSSQPQLRELLDAADYVLDGTEVDLRRRVCHVDTCRFANYGDSETLFSRCKRCGVQL